MRGTVEIKVRPTKLAFLVDPNSATQVREAIRLASSLWGGMHFPILPMHKRMPASWREPHIRTPSASDVACGYIDAFDPDVLVQLSRNVPSYIADTRIPIVKPADIWNTDRSKDEPSHGIGVYSLLNAIFTECFKYKPRYPVKVRIPEIPRRLSLFWASVYGEYGKEIVSNVDKYFSEAMDIERPTVSADSLPELLKPDVFFPRRITSWGLTPNGRLRYGRHSCIYFMDASNIEDVVDYWNLRATGRNVLPLPKQFLQESAYKKEVIDFLVEERRAWPNNPDNFDVASIVRSRHSKMEEIEAYVRTITFPTSGTSGRSQSYCNLQHWYPRVWDDWARGKDGGVVDSYAEVETTVDIVETSDLELQLKPLAPEFAPKNWIFSEGLCANEFSMRLYGAEEHLAEVYPKIKGEHLARAVSGTRGLLGGWRVGRRGLVKLVQDPFTESRRIPPSETILFAWLKDQGWTAELSPPGILAKQIFKRLNGRSEILAEKSLLGFIEHMNGGAVNRDGRPNPNNWISVPREMSVGEVKSRLKEISGRSGLYETFLKNGVFKLGLRTQCPTCQRNTWFALSGLSEQLECPKCLSSFPAAGNVDKSTGAWYYRTAGPFSVPNYAEGAYAVLLTVSLLSDRMHSSFRSTAVQSFTATSPGRRKLEADFAMFWKESLFGDENEGLMFGECKTYGVFKPDDVEKMSYLGKTFPGSILVFSTLRDTLTPEEIARISRIAKAGRRHWKAERPINPVLILTGTELFHWQRPPYCWPEAIKDRFKGSLGLLGLCDATQQIHLNLPSIHEDRQAHAERRRARRSSMQTQKGAGDQP